MRGDRETRLHRELRALPGLKAPSSLSSRVMAAVGKKERHWRTWAAGRQAALIAGVAASAGAVLRIAQEALGALAPRVQAALAFGAGTQKYALLAAEALRAVWWAQRVPLLAAAALMYLMCVGLGTLFYRLAARPRFAAV